MPTRKRIRQINTEELQGEGSFVCVKRVTVGEAEEFRAINSRKFQAPEGEITPEQLAEQEERFNQQKEDDAQEFLSRFIVSWNWVDDEGNPLPQPHNNPEVF